MAARHKRLHTDNKAHESKEDKRRRLCRNSVGNRLSSLDFTPNEWVSDKMQLDTLARILVDIFMEQRRHGKQ